MQLLTNSSSQFVIYYTTGVYHEYPTTGTNFYGSAVAIDGSFVPINVSASNGNLYISPTPDNVFTNNKIYNVSIYVNHDTINSLPSTILQCAYIPTPVLIGQTPSYDTTKSSASFYIINTTIYPSSTTFIATIKTSIGLTYIPGNAFMETNGNNITVSAVLSSRLLQNTNYIVSLIANYNGIQSIAGNIVCISVATPSYTSQVPILDTTYGNVGFTLLNTVINYPSVGTNFYANIINQYNDNIITSGYSINKDTNSGNINIVTSSSIGPFSYNTPYKISLTASHSETYGDVFSGNSSPLTCIYLKPPVLSYPSSNTNTRFVIPFTNNYANYPIGSQYYASFYTDNSGTTLIPPNITNVPYTTTSVDSSNNFIVSTMSGNVYGNNNPYYIGIYVSYFNILSLTSRPIQSTYVAPPNLLRQIPYLINGNVSFEIKNTTVYRAGTTFSTDIKDTTDYLITSISNLPTNPISNPTGNIIVGNTYLLYPNTNYNVSLFATYLNATSSFGNITCIYLSAPSLSYQTPTIDVSGNIAFNIINTVVYPLNTYYTANIKDMLTNVYTQSSYINVSTGIMGNVNVATSPTSISPIFNYNKIYNIMLNASYEPSNYGVITSGYSNSINCISLKPPVLIEPTVNGTTSTFIIPYTTGSYNTYPTNGMSFTVSSNVLQFIGNATVSNTNMIVMANTLASSSPIQSNQIYDVSIYALYNSGSVSSSYSNSVKCIYFTEPILSSYTTSMDTYGNVQFSLLNTTVYPSSISYVANIVDKTTSTGVSINSMVNITPALNGNNLTVHASTPLSTKLFFINKPYDIQIKAKLGYIFSVNSSSITCVSLSTPVLANTTVNRNTTFNIPYTNGGYTYAYPTGTSYTATINLIDPSSTQSYTGTGNETISIGNLIITPSAGYTIVNNQLYSITVVASIYNMNSSQSNDIKYIYLSTPILTGYVPQLDTSGNICFNITNSITNYISSTNFNANIYNTSDVLITTITPIVTKISNNFIISSSLTNSSFSYNTVYKFNINASYNLIVSSNSGNITCVYLTTPVLSPQIIDDSSKFIIPFTTGVSVSNYPSATIFTANIVPTIQSTVDVSNGRFIVTPSTGYTIRNNTPYLVSIDASLNSYKTPYSNTITCVYVPPPVLTTYTSSLSGEVVSFTIKNTVNTYDVVDTYDASSSPAVTNNITVINDNIGNLVVSSVFTRNRPYSIIIDACYNGVVSGYSNPITCVYLETPVLTNSSVIVSSTLSFDISMNNIYYDSTTFTPRFYTDLLKTTTTVISPSTATYTSGAIGTNKINVNSSQFMNNTIYYIGIDVNSNSQNVSSNPILCYYNKAPNLTGYTSSIVNENVGFNITNDVLYSDPTGLTFYAYVYYPSLETALATISINKNTNNSFDVSYNFVANTIYYIKISSNYNDSSNYSNYITCFYKCPAPILQKLTQLSPTSLSATNTVVYPSVITFNVKIYDSTNTLLPSTTNVDISGTTFTISGYTFAQYTIYYIGIEPTKNGFVSDVSNKLTYSYLTVPSLNNNSGQTSSTVFSMTATNTYSYPSGTTYTANIYDSTGTNLLSTPTVTVSYSSNTFTLTSTGGSFTKNTSYFIKINISYNGYTVTTNSSNCIYQTGLVDLSYSTIGNVSFNKNYTNTINTNTYRYITSGYDVWFINNNKSQNTNSIVTNVSGNFKITVTNATASIYYVICGSGGGGGGGNEEGGGGSSGEIKYGSISLTIGSYDCSFTIGSGGSGIIYMGSGSYPDGGGKVGWGYDGQTTTLTINGTTYTAGKGCPGAPSRYGGITSKIFNLGGGSGGTGPNNNNSYTGTPGSNIINSINLNGGNTPASWCSSGGGGASNIEKGNNGNIAYSTTDLRAPGALGGKPSSSVTFPDAFKFTDVSYFAEGGHSASAKNMPTSTEVTAATTSTYK